MVVPGDGCALRRISEMTYAQHGAVHIAEAASVSRVLLTTDAKA